MWEGTPDPELGPETWQKRVIGVLTCERGRMGLAQRDSWNSQAGPGPVNPWPNVDRRPEPVREFETTSSELLTQVGRAIHGKQRFDHMSTGIFQL